MGHNKAPYKAENAKEAARIIHAGVDLANTGSGILFGVPIPEKDSIDNSIMEKEINKALEECNEKGIIGKHVTPYVLEKLNELSKGESLKANLSLIILTIYNCIRMNVIIDNTKAIFIQVV